MTTETENLERIIYQLQNLNDFDGETVEYILSQIGYSDYMLRSLMLSQPISNVEYAYNERIEMDLTNNTRHPFIHRIEAINEELIIINSHIKKHNLTPFFELSTDFSDSCITHFANIKIACDLGSDECLAWNMYNLKEEEEEEVQIVVQEKQIQEVKEEVEERTSLKDFWQNLNNFNAEAKELCLGVWLENKNYTRKQFFEEHNVTYFELKYIIHEFWNEIENNDTLTFDNFEKYWEFFITNWNKDVSLQHDSSK